MFKTINNGILPKRFSKYSAGFDVCSNEDIVIVAGEAKLIGLGIAIDLQKYYECFDKSPNPSFEEAMKRDPQDFFFIRAMREYYLELHIAEELSQKGLIAPPKIINIDFPDELKMSIHNPVTNAFYRPQKNDIVCSGASAKEDEWIDRYYINKGDKIGQLILKRHEGYKLPQEYTIQN